jgi:hypothetical protein
MKIESGEKWSGSVEWRFEKRKAGEKCDEGSGVVR